MTLHLRPINMQLQPPPIKTYGTPIHMYHLFSWYHQPSHIAANILHSPPISPIMHYSPHRYAHIKRRWTPLKEKQPQEKYTNIQ
jgi:hypothetical protein